MSKLHKILTAVFIVSLFFAGASTFLGPQVEAQLTPSNDQLCEGDNCKAIGGDPSSYSSRDGIYNVIVDLAQLITFIGVGLAIVVIVLGGIQYFKPDGDASNGKKLILNGVIGLVVIILAYSIVAIIVSLLTGGDLLNPDGSTGGGSGNDSINNSGGSGNDNLNPNPPGTGSSEDPVSPD